MIAFFFGKCYCDLVACATDVVLFTDRRMSCFASLTDGTIEQILG